jgi:hypothetical protein
VEGGFSSQNVAFCFVHVESKASMMIKFCPENNQVRTRDTYLETFTLQATIEVMEVCEL